MTSQLIEAAQIGNVDSLLNLVNDEPNILRLVALESGSEIPLHIACKSGHLSFVKEILRLKPEFATELHNGFSPLHIASDAGDLDIVKELLMVGNNELCRIHGREGRTPLHGAIVKGRIDVVRELLLANCDSIEDETARRETALHLAVKHKQFEALKCLVEHLKQFNKEDLLNKKDGDGNTILHLAVSRKNSEVVFHLLNEHSELLELNSKNKKGLTALDLLLLFQKEAGDKEIKDALYEAGVRRSELANGYDLSQRRGGSYLEDNPLTKWIFYFRYNKGRDKPGDVRSVLLVIVALLVTTTFQAVFTPPGGVWQDDNKPHVAGQAISVLRNGILYGFFVFWNSFTFSSSVRILQVLTARFPMQRLLIATLLSLVGSYCISLVAFVPNKGAPLAFVIIGMLGIASSLVTPLEIYT